MNNSTQLKALESLLKSEGFDEKLKELGWTPPCRISVSTKPSTKRPTFNWLKWSNPLGGNDEFIEEYTYESAGGDPEFGINTPISILTTDGFIPLKSYNNLYTAFDWWVVHVNFRVTPEMEEALDNLDGIEILDFVTNNRIRMAIGLAYNGSEVRRSVEDTLREIWKETYSGV